MTSALSATPPGASRLSPDDDANRQLLASVRPSHWVNPRPRARYHLVVIGAGTAGLVTAAAAAGLGATVALVERSYMGGDCLNVGCVPSKAMIRSARAWRAASEAHATFGGPTAGNGSDFAAVMARMRRLRAQLSHYDGAARFTELGVDVFFGEARFAGPATIAVDDVSLAFRRAVIATGSRPTVPTIPGLADIDYLTNETVFNLTECPKHLLVLGAGPEGCELAQTFARLGARVTVVSRGTRILARDEPESTAIVQQAMEHDGVQFRLGAEITRAARDGSERRIWVRAAGREEAISADQLLLALGRTPNTERLGLENAGIAADADGVRVDDRLRTTNVRVFAAGDVAGHERYTHVADAHARLAVRNALVASRLHMGYQRVSSLVIPRCTYTCPEIAHVGWTPAVASTHGLAIDTITVDLSAVDRAVLDQTDVGALRLHLKRGTDRIIGATLVADRAGDLISGITLAMTNGVGLSGIGRTIYPYPTHAEVARKAADVWLRAKLTPRVKRALALFFHVCR